MNVTKTGKMITAVEGERAVTYCPWGLEWIGVFTTPGFDPATRYFVNLAQAEAWRDAVLGAEEGDLWGNVYGPAPVVLS